MPDLSLTSTDIPRLLYVAGAIVFLVFLSEAIRKGFRLSDEFSRKSVHIGTGVFVFFAPFWFPKAAPILLISAVFTVLNFIAYKTHVLKSVHHTARMSYGTVYYPLALFILTFFLWDSSPDIVVASLLALAIGDGAAGMTGEMLKKTRIYRVTSDEKSLEGSAAMFAGTFVALLATVLVYRGEAYAFASQAGAAPMTMMLSLLAVSLFATAWEGASSRGLDNITVPLFTALALKACFGNTVSEGALQFSTGVLLGLLIAILSYKARLLQASGAVATFLLASVMYGLGGWQWTLPIFAFFILSSLLSKGGKVHKAAFEHVFEKSGTRDVWQVVANGGIAGVLVILSVVYPSDRWYVMYLGAIAAVTADTWSTELGVFSTKNPISILTFRRVPRGTSGGISLIGTLSGLLGAGIVSAIGILTLAGSHPKLFVAAASGGFIGNLADSLLGATVQAQFQCVECGTTTEKTIHCHKPAVLKRGITRINNDMVNVLCSVAGTGGTILLMALL